MTIFLTSLWWILGILGVVVAIKIDDNPLPQEEAIVLLFSVFGPLMLLGALCFAVTVSVERRKRLNK